MSYKDALRTSADQDRKSLEAQLAALPKKEALIAALPEGLDDHCVSESISLTLGSAWLGGTELRASVPSDASLKSLLELLPPVDLTLYESSTFCFAPTELREEVTKGRPGHKESAIFPVTFFKAALTDGFQWWTRIAGSLVRVRMDLLSRRTRAMGNGDPSSGDVTRWVIAGLPGGTLLQVGACTPRYPGDVYVYWQPTANLKAELAKNQEVFRNITTHP